MEFSLRIALVEPVGGHGGMNYYDLGLARGLVRAGVRVDWYTCERTLEGSETGIQVKKYFAGAYGSGPRPWRLLRYLLGLWRTGRDARREGVELAHLHFFHARWLDEITCVVLRKFGLKLVITLHDVESFSGRDRPERFQRIAASAEALVVHNAYSRQCVGALLGMDQCDSRLHVIPHGNYLDVVRTVSREAARAKLGITDPNPVVLFFGQIKKVKGLDILLRAFARFKAGGAPGTLLVAGKIWHDDIDSYLQLIDDLSIADHVRLENRYIADEEVDDFFSAADVVVLPYRRIYQSGVLLMAMSYGKCVIVSDLPPMLEIVNHDRNGLVFGTEDPQSLAAVLTQCLARSGSGDLDRMGAAALADMRDRFAWDAIGERTAELYQRLLGECPP